MISLVLSLLAAAQPVPGATLAPAPPPRAEALRLPPQPETYRANRLIEPENNPSAWVWLDRAVDEETQRQLTGPTRVRLAVNKWGRVSDCTVTGSSGLKSFDDDACASLAERAIFIPATNARGEPIAGTWDHAVEWRPVSDKAVPPPVMIATSAGPVTAILPRGPSASDAFYRDPTLNDFPPEARDARMEGVAIITVTTDPEGGMADCSVTMSSGHEALDQASCHYVGSLAPFTAARDLENKPTTGRFVRRVSWKLPSATTTVAPPAPAYRPGPMSLPLVGNGKSGFEVVADKDGKVVSCTVIEEGMIPVGAMIGTDFCRNAEERGVQKAIDPNGDPVARRTKVVFSMEEVLGENE